MITPTCKRCKILMEQGIATAQTYVGGEPDFFGDTRSSTFTAGGPGFLMVVWKCPKCGHSISGVAP